MNVSELFGQVKNLLNVKEQKKIADRQELVNAVASDKPPTPAKIAAALEELGMTPEELAEAVEYKHRRLALKAQLGTVPKLRAELIKVQETYQAEMTRWTPIQQAHQTIVLNCEVEANRLEAAISDAKAAEGRLRAGYAGPLLDELAAVEAEQLKIWQEQQPFQHSRMHYYTELTCYRAPDFPLTETQQVSLKRTVAEYDTQLAQLKTKSAVLDKRAAQIEAQMLQP